MKEEINLLPPAAQRLRVRRILRKRLSYIGRRVTVSVALVWVVLAAAGSWFNYRERLLTQELRGESERAGGAEQEARKINELMGIIARRVDDHPAWLADMKGVVTAVPGEARLEVVALSADGKLMVRGVTNSRTAVLDMERSLKALPWVEAVEAPLQNFAAGGKGEFSFTLVRKGSSHEEG